MHTKNPALRKITFFILISLIPLMTFGKVDCLNSNIYQATDKDCTKHSINCESYWGCSGDVARNCRTSNKNPTCEAGIQCKGNDKKNSNPNSICNDSIHIY